MAHITHVAPLVLIDEHQHSVTRADGSPVVDPTDPRAKHFKLRWTVADHKFQKQLLIDAKRATLARQAHRELLEALAARTEVGDDFWPVTGQRPASGKHRRKAHVAVGMPVPRTPATTVATPEVVAAPMPHPLAHLGFLDFFDQVVAPARAETAKGAQINTYRSFARGVDGELWDITPEGRVRITVGAMTDEQLQGAINRLSAQGNRPRPRSDSWHHQLRIVVNFVTTAAAAGDDPLRPDNLSKKLVWPTDKQKRINRLHPEQRKELVPKEPTYRSARQRLTFWDVIDLIFPHIPEFYLPHCWMRLLSGPRPCELSAYEPGDFDFDLMVVTTRLSITLHGPRDNDGIRLDEGGLKHREDDEERHVGLLNIPAGIAAIRSAVESAPARAAMRKAALLDGTFRKPRSESVDLELWKESELLFAEKCAVFTTPSGAPFDRSNFDGKWRKAVEAAFPDVNDKRRLVRFYDLREIGEAAWMDFGASAESVLLMYGHSEKVQKEHYNERRIAAVSEEAKAVTAALEAQRQIRLANQAAEPVALAAPTERLAEVIPIKRGNRESTSHDGPTFPQATDASAPSKA